jgi:hypothetical protein
MLSDVISIETLISFQIATAGDSDKQVMFSRLCKHHLRYVRSKRLPCVLAGVNFSEHYIRRLASWRIVTLPNVAARQNVI